MTNVNKIQRKKIEDIAWDQIDEIKEKNKYDLAVNIQEGMESKSILTTKTGIYKTSKSQKDTLYGDI